jgi:hypothetical protein
VGRAAVDKCNIPSKKKNIANHVQRKRDQKWFLDQIPVGKAGLEMPCTILAATLGMNLPNELFQRSS